MLFWIRLKSVNMETHEHILEVYLCIHACLHQTFFFEHIWTCTIFGFIIMFSQYVFVQKLHDVHLHTFVAFSPKVSGFSRSLLSALMTIELHFEWSMQLFVVCDHARPIPIFQPSVVLVKPMDADTTYRLFPTPVSKRGRGSGSRGRGQGRGRRGRGQSRGRGRSRGRGDLEPISAPSELLAIEDGDSGTDEACDESDGQPDGDESSTSESSKPAGPDED